MKRAFIMPLVLILMAMLLGTSLVLSKIAEDKTNSLKSQETGYYSGKELTIKLVKSEDDSYNSENFFSGGISTYYQDNPTGEDGLVEFNGDSKYKNNYDTKIPTLTVINKGAPWQDITCIETEKGADGWCEEGTAAWGREAKLDLPPYEESTATGSGGDVSLGWQEDKDLTPGNYRNINMNSETEIRFKKGTYRIKKIEMGSPSTLYMEPGDYWIENITTSNNSKIIPTGTGTVRIYLGNSTINHGTDFNDSGKPNQLLIVAYEDFTVGNDNPFYGGIYGEKLVGLDYTAKVHGAVKGKKVKFINWSGSEVIYDEDVKNIDFGQVADWIVESGSGDSEDDCW